MACDVNKSTKSKTADAKVENIVSRLEELLQTHRALYCQVWEQRQRLEAECAVHKKLLRPWCPVVIGDVVEAPDPQTSCTASPERTVTDPLECEEVHLVNSVLARAVRARSAHKKDENNKVLDKNPCDEKGRNKLRSLSDDQHVVKSVSSRVPALANSHSRPSTLKDQKVSSKAPKVPSHVDVTRRSSSAGGPKSAASVPVHRRAPFKTEPDRPRRPLSRKATAKQQAGNKGSCDRTSGRQNKTSGSLLEKPCEGVLKGPCSDVTGEIRHSTPSVGDVTSSLQSLNVNDNASVLEGVVIRVQAETSVQPMPQEAPDQSTVTNQSSTTSKLKTFDLIRDGCKLTIPSRLRKLTKHNHLLRQKLRTSSLTTKVDFVSHRDQFLKRLEQETDVDEAVRLGSSVHRLMVLHENLMKEIYRISDSPLTDSMPATDVLRKRMVLEMILQSYEEAGQEVAALTKGENLYPGDVIYPHNVEFPSPVIKEHRLIGPSLSGCLGYHREKDLFRLARLQHRLTSLSLDEQVVSEVKRSILPLLHNQIQTSSTSVVPLYRATYSLLSRPGHQLPTIVRDES